MFTQNLIIFNRPGDKCSFIRGHSSLFITFYTVVLYLDSPPSLDIVSYFCLSSFD